MTNRQTQLLVGVGSKEGSLDLLDTVAALLEVELLAVVALVLDLLLGLANELGVLADGGKSLLVGALNLVVSNAVLDVLGELRVVGLLVFLSERLHVLSNVNTEDVLAVHRGIELLALLVVTGEAALAIRGVNWYEFI
jgi:hypothetical protein